MNTDMVLDALEQALHDRGMPKNVIHHSDRGVEPYRVVGESIF
ncbi:Transposase-like protein [Acinetobacter johnsonii]|uniref:Transposase-like protein n=1 Tax=Acinetobacter johnsonii TaxID=40214 RepID=A0A380TQ54_ACIJO|nr:Transposase-like protein [Acinetobacter johnsonii]